MFKKMMNTKLRLLKNQKGLTLVELLAVIVILGVVAAIAVPAIGGIINNSKVNADKQTELLLKDTAVHYLTNTNPSGTGNVTSVTIAALVAANYLKEAPKQQSGTDTPVYTSVTVEYTAAAGWKATATSPSTP
ncbi:prepilin-type N-terminal cleavage/methylation domain-containing protein [Paenibacillus sp. 2RAB27]|uniref:prepilin-type N-terminal cleavage/methylation domain-containing protein n=1 Tax=Paenibacillus sp. 2RAB27 TaxID=3232991 RepID=UPI003F9D2FEF